MLKAIETRYKGYRFRSRLEARWAVFFDALGVPWEYEREGYDLGEVGYYLPDFFFAVNTTAPFWIEIKGQAPNEQEIEKIKALAIQSNHCVILVSGTPGEEGWHLYDGTEMLIHPDGGFERWWLWCELFCPKKVHAKKEICPRIEQAYNDARSARFEHGEQGR